MALEGNTLRWGILGAGFAAAEFARGLRAVPRADLRAVASRTGDRAAWFAKEFGVPRRHGSPDELFADPEVDLVYIATPNDRHRDHCLRAIESGKAVVCEKPFALHAGEAREIAEAARRRQVFCMEGMWTRFLPAVQRAKQLIGEGAIGELRWISASLGHRIPPGDWRLGPGGGSLLDLGIYGLSLMALFAGRPACLASVAVVGPNGSDEQVGATLVFGNGALGSLATSFQCNLPSEAMLIGDNGHLHVHAPLYRPEAISLVRTPGGAEQTRSAGRLKTRAQSNRLVRLGYLRLAPLVAAVSGRGARTFRDPVAGNGYGYEAEEAMRCVREGRLESPRMPLDDTIAVLEVADAIRLEWSRRGASGPITHAGDVV